MTVDPSQDAAPPRSLTARAIVLGLVLALGFGAFATFNDWTLNNAYLFNNMLPPVAVAVLLALSAVLNPLLGSRRLRRGELAVVAALMLAAGGVASSGLIRFWSAAIPGPGRTLAREPRDELRQPLDDAAIASARAALRDAALADFPRHDADGDGRLSPAEAYGGAERIARDDRDGDGALDREEYADGRLAADPRAAADWRWAYPHDLAIGVPPIGAVDPTDPEFAYLVDGYFLGRDGEPSPRVGHRATVTWRAADGVERTALALAGAARESHPRAEALDLGSGLGAALAGRKPGESVDMPDGAVTVVAVAPPPIAPWYAWIGPAVAWSPFIIGLALASVALAFLVKQQWLHHERLPYPVSSALASLIDDPAPGSRLPPMLRERAFWYAAGFSFLVVAWRALDLLGFVPFNIVTGLDLSKALEGEPWTLMPHHRPLTKPTIFFAFVGLAFLVPVATSFSVWSLFLIANVLVMMLRVRGVGVGAHHLGQVDAGAFFAMAGLILWLGRRWYLAVAAAAVGRGNDPAARAAAPWLWGAFAGVALIVAWLVAHGAPAGASIALTVLLFTFLIVVSRILAETGVAYLMFPTGLNPVMHATFGFGLPLASLMPLAVVGSVIVLAREALMPYAVSASHLADRGGVRANRLAPLLIATAVAGAAVALAAKVWVSHRWYGHCDGWHTYQHEMHAVADAVGASMSGSPGPGGDRGETAVCFGLGATVAAVFGIARLAFSWWPFHPLALCVALTWAGGQLWGSFFIAWAAKAGVMRYGGVGLYRRLVPAAIGLAAGEAVAITIYGLAKVVAIAGFDHYLPSYFHALPP